MQSNFFSLDNEKQDRIINACLKEFTLNGYEKASTNKIVKEANISKGLLFHYFSNKKQLYLFLFNYATNRFIEEFIQMIDFNEKDIILRIKQIVNIKIMLLKKNPLLFSFLERSLFENAEVIQLSIKTKKQELEKLTYDIFKDIAESKFKEDIDINYALKIIAWTVNGYTNDLLLNVQLKNTEIDYEKAIKEVEKYMDIFKKIFYKVEE